MLSSNQIPTSFEPRDYEIKALEKLSEFFFKWIQGILEDEIRYYETDERAKEEVAFFTAALIHMATGSGKTFTVGSFVEYIFGLRERFKNTKRYKNTPPLKILVLGDKIDLIEQLKQSFIDGNDIKGLPAIFSETFKQSLTVEKNHSRVKISEILNIPVGNIENNEIVFSTFQTAKNNLDTKREFNIIIVDEAHHLNSKEYKQIFEQFYKPFNAGPLGPEKLPLVLCMTATATQALKQLIGNPIVDFSLPYYLASEYAPKVQYNIVTNQSISQEKIEEILKNIKEIKNIDGVQEKKSRLKTLEDELNNSLSDFEDNKAFINDLKNRVTNMEKEKTILFVPTIEKANKIAKQINQTYSKSIALAYHSETKKDNVIETFSKQHSETKVLVVVDKLNEGVDMPFVDNVIFGRGTNSPVLFTQQFGRGLRGKFVKFYDYVGGIKNLVWMNNLVQEIREASEDEKEMEEIIEVNTDSKVEKIKNEKNTFEGEEINIYNIIGQIQEVKNILAYPTATKEEIIMIYNNQEIQDTHLSKANYRTFSKYFNKSLSGKYKFKLPETRSIFKEILEIKEHILNLEDIKKVLLGEKIERLRIATLEEIKVLFHNKQLDTNLLTRRKYQQCIEEFDENLSKKMQFQLPRTWHSLNIILGLEKKHRTKRNIIKTLEGKQIRISKHIKIGNKNHAKNFYERGIIKQEFLTSKLWKIHQQEIQEKYHIQFPQSFEGLICLLLGTQEVNKIKKNGKNIPRGKRVAIHLLLGKKFHELEVKRIANKQDIISIKDTLKNYLTDKKLKVFIKENAHKYNFEIPRSMNGLISSAGGDNSISSGAQYLIHLINGGGVYESFETQKAKLMDIAKLVKNGEITLHDLSRTGWKLKYQYLKEKNLTFEVPKYNSLIFIITGVSKGGKTGKEYLYKILKEQMK